MRSRKMLNQTSKMIVDSGRDLAQSRDAVNYTHSAIERTQATLTRLTEEVRARAAPYPTPEVQQALAVSWVDMARYIAMMQSYIEVLLAEGLPLPPHVQVCTQAENDHAACETCNGSRFTMRII